MKRASLLAVALLVALGGCSQTPATAVIVVLDADPAVAARTTSIDVEVLGGANASTLAPAFTQNGLAPRFPVWTTIAPRDGDTTRALGYVATAHDAGGAVATVRAVSHYVPGHVRILRLVLQASCFGVTCNGTDTCAAGGCVPGTVDPSMLPDYTGRDAGSDGATPIDATIDAPSSDGGFDFGMPDAGAPPCDPMEPMPETGVVFVREGGTGSGTSASSPLGTIAAALPLARTGRPRIVIAEGSYPEALDIDMPPAGLVLEGGWMVTGAVWRRDCASGRDATLIASPDAVGLHIGNAMTGVELRHLTVQTSPPAAAPPPDTSGGTRIGLLVTGDASVVTLTDVRILAEDGERGGDASPAVGAAPATCDGRTCSDEAVGPNGTDGADGMSRLAFDASGYAPVDGSDGTPGGPGHDGRAGMAGYTARTDCCGGCNFGGDCSSVCNAAAFVPTGACGCAGRPGGVGQRGRGGGASVGVLVSGTDAVVSTTFSLIRAGNGGAGSAGTESAPASPPTPGTQGMAHCCTGCDITNPGPCGSGDGCACYMVTCSDHFTTEGTLGGMAGTSGRGGGGAGGPAFSVVGVGGARFVSDPTVVLQHGAGGTGGGGANAGMSGDLAL